MNVVSSENLKYFKEKIDEKINNGDSLSNDFYVKGSLGGYKSGDKIESNTPIEEIIKTLLTNNSSQNENILEWGKLGGRL